MIEKRKDTLTAAKITGCHTLERASCYAASQNSASVVETANNYKIMVDSYPELMNIKSCVKNIVFPNIKGDIPKIEKYCPKYTCDSKLSQCAVMSADIFGKNITMNVCKNSTADECKVDEAQILEYDSLNISCTTKDIPPRKR